MDKAITAQDTYRLAAPRPASWRIGASYLVAVVVGMVIALALSAAINSKSTTTTTSTVTGPSAAERSVAALARSERADAAAALTAADRPSYAFLRSEHADAVAASTVGNDPSITNLIRSEHADAVTYFGGGRPSLDSLSTGWGDSSHPNGK